MTESPGSRTSARVAVWLAVLGLPLSLFNGVGGLLGLAAVAIASPMLKRRTDDRRAFATVLLGFCSMLLGSCIASSMLVGPGRAADRVDPTGTVQDGTHVAMDGSVIRLGGVDDRPVLVDVWATWCPPCIESIPTLEAIHRDLADEVRVISIATEPAGVVGPWLEARRARVAEGVLKPIAVPTYPIITSDRPLPELATAARAYPTMWLLAPDGTVLHEMVGGQDLPTILTMIRMAGVP
ncbi:MAG: hypothetical protein CMJ34_15010 [Phycisphaerae bacterium]|nr:hypothetical protein [Phycisphaerae bacterium]